MTLLLATLLRVLLAYLLGSVLGSLLVGRLRGGVDIRTLGSGNAGGTNALRTQGKLFGGLVLLIDFAKGWLASAWLATMPLPGLGQVDATSALHAWVPALCAFAALLGHVYPVWFGFRGGKGIATGAGAVFGLQSVVLLPALAVWVIVLLASRFVGLASLCAAAALPVATLLLVHEPHGPLLAFSLAAAVFAIYTHRANIARMRAGTESRLRLGRRGPQGIA